MADSEPRELSAEELEVEVQAETGEAEPTETPPEVVAMSAEEEAITAWQNNRRINALWSKNENRNSWVGVAGIGWKKLANNSDSAIVALTILGAHAKQTQGPVNYREESDKMIHEMYVW